MMDCRWRRIGVGPAIPRRNQSQMCIPIVCFMYCCPIYAICVGLVLPLDRLEPRRGLFGWTWSKLLRGALRGESRLAPCSFGCCWAPGCAGPLGPRKESWNMCSPYSFRIPFSLAISSLAAWALHSRSLWALSSCVSLPSMSSALASLPFISINRRLACLLW